MKPVNQIEVGYGEQQKEDVSQQESPFPPGVIQTNEEIGEKDNAHAELNPQICGGEMAIVACQDLARQRNKQYAAGEQRRQIKQP